jgi:hypothetical protein
LHGDSVHPNDEAYVLYAERTARVMVDAGLGEMVQSVEELEQDVVDLFANATVIIQDLEQRGLSTEKIDEAVDRAEYLNDTGYYYTAKWELVNKVIPPLESVINNWDDISDMFQEAQTHIDTATQTGFDTQTLEQWYATAENSWLNRLDYGGTRWYLEKIIQTEINELTTITTGILTGIPAILIQIRKHKGTNEQEEVSLESG